LVQLVVEIFDKLVTNEMIRIYCLAALNQLRCYNNWLLL